MRLKKLCIIIVKLSGHEMLCRFVVAWHIHFSVWIIFLVCVITSFYFNNTQYKKTTWGNIQIYGEIFKYSNLDSITSLLFEPLECCELQDRGNHLGQFYWHDPKGKNWWNQISLVSCKKGRDEQTWRRLKQIAIVGFWKLILTIF